MRKGIYFDFWGTLWLAMERSLALNDPLVERVADEATQAGLCQNRADAWIKVRRFSGVPAPGVCAVLPAIRKLCPLFIVSHSPLDQIEQILTAWGLAGHFDAVASTQTYQESKGEVIERLADEYQAEPILYVGDSLGDLHTAEQLGLDYLHIGAVADPVKANCCCSSLLEALYRVLHQCRVQLQLGDLSLPS